MATNGGRGNKKIIVRVDAGGSSTIVAALRLFQRTYEYRDDEVLSEDFPEMFTAEHLRFGVVVEPTPLCTDDIDDLCERLSGVGGAEIEVTEY
jgi:hypothetical protein